VQALVREAREVAAHVEAHVVHVAARERRREVAAGVLEAGLGQVARQAVGARMGQHALQVDRAGEAPAAAGHRGAGRRRRRGRRRGAGPGAPLQLQLALGVRVGEAHVVQRDRDGRRLRRVVRRLDLPARVGAEAIERDHGLLEHAGQLDAAAVEREVRGAAALVRVERELGVAPAGPAAAAALGDGAGGHGEAVDLCSDPVDGGRGQRARPARVELAHHAFGLVVGQPLLRDRGQRQRRGEAAHQREVEVVGRQLAAGHRREVVPRHGAGGQRRGRRRRHRVPGRRGHRLVAVAADERAPAELHHDAALQLLPRQPHVARWPGDAVGRLEAEVLGRQRDAGRVAARVQAAAGMRDGQRLDLRRQPHGDAGELHVGGGRAPVVVLEVQPQPQRALAALELERQVDVALQLRDVAARQVGVEGARPAAPVAGVREQRLAGARAQREAVAPVGGRRGVDAHVVRAQAVAQDDVDVGQLERRRGALLVDPAHGAAAQHDLLLAEEPVERCGLVGAGDAGARSEVEAADVHVAGGVAPHQQARVLDVELRQPRLQHQQRLRRQRRRHPRQPQRLRAGRVAQHDVAQVDCGYPRRRAHADVADSHRNPYRATGMAFYLGAPILDVRQNPPLQSQPREHDQAQEGQARIDDGFPGQLEPAPPRHEAQPPDDWIEKCARLQSHEKFGTGWQRPRPQCRWAR